MKPANHCAPPTTKIEELVLRVLDRQPTDDVDLGDVLNQAKYMADQHGTVDAALEVARTWNPSLFFVVHSRRHYVI